MDYTIHNPNDQPILEVESDDFRISTLQDALDLLGSAMFKQIFKIIISSHHLSPDFFELKTGLAGEILQKFSTYDMQLAIVGDFSHSESRSLSDFIKESNKTGRILFVPTVGEAISRLSS